MNSNKYPSLEWCEKYGHLFPESDCTLIYDAATEQKKIIERHELDEGWNYTFIANCPDQPEIINYLLEKHKLIIISLTLPNKYNGYRMECELYNIVAREILDEYSFAAGSPLEALMQAVELVEAK